jgi:flagellar motor switch protein FliM
MIDPTPNLDQKALADMVAIATGAAVSAAKGDIVEYDWRVPSRFVRAERDSLDAFGRKVATAVSRDLSALLRQELKFQAGSVTQHYGSAAATDTPQYGVPLADKSGRTCGMVGLAPAMAVGWVERLLGSRESGSGGARPLSSLESALLVDIVGAIVKTVSAASKESGGPTFQHVESVSAEKSPLADRGTDEFCRIALAPADAGAKTAIAIIMLSSALAPVADPENAKKPAMTPEETRKILLGHVEGASVSATVRLGTANATMRDLASLEPGDIILLTRTVNDPIDMLVKGKAIHSGYPVISEGRYAFQVLERRQWPRLVLERST